MSDRPQPAPDAAQGDSGAGDSQTVAGTVVQQLNSPGFDEWYRGRQYTQNIHEGKPYFNGPSDVPPPERHSPSQLLHCHRKQVYRQCNAPKETEDPNGIFWMGTQVEEELVVPYLQDLTARVDTDIYVRNSMWIDTEVDVGGTTVRFKGATDPVFVGRESEPLVVTEAKTKQSLEHVDDPSERHRAQVHAYMHGLSEKYDLKVREAVILYTSRKSLEIDAYTVGFDVEFWEDSYCLGNCFTDRDAGVDNGSA